MKHLDIVTPIEVLEYDELDAADRSLVDAAREATLRSYAPYSHFSVGAAIRLANGEVVTGSNQENAAFSSGTCAERSACFYAGAQYPGTGFDMIAIAARGTDGKPLPQPIPPCGSCRQSLLEYEKLTGHNVPLLLIGRDSIYRLPSVASLLPLSFSEF